MRGWLKHFIGLAMAVGVASAMLRRRSHEARVDPAVKRRVAPAMEQVRARMTAEGFAHHASLWRRGALGGCAVSARWSDRPVSAQFSSVMLMDGPMTVTRTQYRPLRLPAMSETAVARAVVKIRPGAAPVVRLLRSATFKPKRALYGATELKAAA